MGGIAGMSRWGGAKIRAAPGARSLDETQLVITKLVFDLLVKNFPDALDKAAVERR